MFENSFGTMNIYCTLKRLILYIRLIAGLIKSDREYVQQTLAAYAGSPFRRVKRSLQALER